ncbi:glycoside hydrolase, partial [bacterium]|nr:glycoside hydrolase [bacterium]
MLDPYSNMFSNFRLPTGLALALLLCLTEFASSQDYPTHEELARHWAPVVFQDVDPDMTLNEGGRFDFVSCVDFDGNWRGDDNWDNAADPGYALRPYLYWWVTETETHWYVGYAVFHPRDWEFVGARLEPSRLTDHENDLEGAVFVLLKDGVSPYGDLRLVSTMAHNRFFYYRDESSGIALPMHRVSAGAPGLGLSCADPFGTDCDSSIYFAGSRPCLFVEARGHGIGKLTWALQESASGVILSDGRTYDFRGGDGVLYLPFPSAGSVPTEPSSLSIHTEHRYQLRSLDDLWSRRQDVGATTALFEEEFDFAAGECGIPRLSKYFCTDGAPWVLAASPPWGWENDDGTTGRGKWFLMPAHAVNDHIGPGFPDALMSGFYTYIRNPHLTDHMLPPTDLSASDTECTEVSISWTDNSTREDGYRVYRDGTLVCQTGPDAQSCSDYPPPDAPFSHEYRVVAFDACGESEAATDVGGLNAPPSLTSDDVSPGVGTTQELYRFEVTYRDPEGQPPSLARVYVNGSFWDMEPEAGSPDYTEAVFFVDVPGVSLGCGTFTHYYVFNDGQCGTLHDIRHPAHSDRDGPRVDSAEPWVRVVEPDGHGDHVPPDPGASFLIQWSTDDIDCPAGGCPLICSLYWDTDNDPANGGLVPIPGGSGLACPPGDHEFTWDMSPLPEDWYYIYIAVEDECGSTDDDYGNGPIVYGPIDECADNWSFTPTPFHSPGVDHHILVGPDDTHHLFYGDAADGGILMYSRKPTEGDWSVPVPIGACTGASTHPFGAAIEGSTIDVVFEKYLTSYELFHVRSSDGGATWSPEHPITADDGNYSRYPQISTSNGTTHLVWIEKIGSQGHNTIYYRRSQDAGNTWASPTELSDPAFSVSGPDDAPAIISQGDLVHVAFSHRWSDKVIYRRSTNAGFSWNASVTLAEPINMGDATMGCSGPDVYVAWEGRESGGNYAIFFTRSTSDGVSFDAARQVTFDEAHTRPALSATNGVVCIF